MAEKKVAKTTATKKAEVKAEVKKAPVKKAPAKKAVAKTVLALNSENAGFKAGDVYQALASAEKALTVKEVAKVAKISEEEALIGMGWLFKEGKIKGEGDKVELA